MFRSEKMLVMTNNPYYNKTPALYKHYTSLVETGLNLSHIVHTAAGPQAGYYFLVEK